MSWKIFIGLLIYVQNIKMSQEEDCDQYEVLIPGETYYLYNLDYPKRSTGSSCIFEMVAQKNCHIFVTCSIDIDSDGGNCGADKLSIALDGDLRNAEVFCGKGVIERSSTFRHLTVAYKSSVDGSGVLFLCSAQAVPDPCDCGWTQTLQIEGGEDAHEGEYPSVAGFFDVKKKIIFCGGTIISHRLVVSAKHCFEGYADVSSIAVAVGLRDTTSRSKYGALYRIDSILFPPDTEPNDIALVKTRDEFIWTNGVAPACLPFQQKNDTFVDKDVIVLGWNSDDSGHKHTVLQHAQAEVISNSNCSSYYPSISATQMCTVASGEDACQMGSGGPVLYVTDRQILVGIIGNISNCGEKVLRVNTRITPYLDWIESVALENLCHREFNV